MKKWILIIVLFLIAVAVRIFFFPGENSWSKAGAKSKELPPSLVKVNVIKTDTFNEQWYASGSLISEESVSITPEVSGRIIKINFNEGERVEKGQLLVKLNDSEWQAALKKVQIQMELASLKENRLKQMLLIKGVSQEEYDAAKSALDLLTAEKESIQVAIDKTEIKAPFTGTIGLRNVSEGGMVNPGSVISSLEKTDWLKVDFYVPEKYAHLLKKGGKFVFSSENDPTLFQATVAALDPRLDAQTRSLHVHGIVSNSNGKLISGSYVQIKLPISETQPSILIPTEAIIPEMRGKKVFVVRNGKASAQLIKTGLRTSTKVQVTEGLQAGDSLIVSGIMNIKDKAPVKIIKSK